MKVSQPTPFILVLISLLHLSFQAHGQLGTGANSRIEGKAKFMPIPYVNYDRSMGFTLGAVPFLMFNPSHSSLL